MCYNPKKSNHPFIELLLIKKERWWCARHDDYPLAINFSNSNVVGKYRALYSLTHLHTESHSFLHTSPSHIGLKWVNPCFPCSVAKSIHIHHCGGSSLFPDTVILKQWHLHNYLFCFGAFTISRIYRCLVWGELLLTFVQNQMSFSSFMILEFQIS